MNKLATFTAAALGALAAFCVWGAAPAEDQGEGEPPLAATREWAVAEAMAEGLYPGGMADAPEELWTRYIEGVTALQGWDLDAAEESLKGALKIAARDSERLAVYHALAKVFLHKADLKRGWANAEKAVQLAETEADPAALAFVLKDASFIKRLAGDTPASLALAARGYEIAERMEDPLLRGFYQLCAAEVAFEMGEPAVGARLIEEAAPVFEEYENEYCLAQIDFFRGFVKYQGDDVDGALELCRQSIEEYKKFDDRHSEARALGVIGECLAAKEDYDGALEAHMAALDIFRSFDDRICEAKALLFCAGLFRVWGQYDSAVTALDEALAVGREYKVKPIVAEALKSRAVCLGAQGDFKGCIASFKEAKKAAAACKDAASERQVDFALASFKLVKGNLDVARAVKELRDLEGRCEAAGDAELLAGVYDMLARAYFIEEDVDKVLTYRQRLVDLHTIGGDKKALASALSNQSLMLLGTYRYEASIEASRRAIALYEELGDEDGEGYNYRGLGICYIILGRYDDAVGALEKAAELHRGTGNGAQLGRDYMYLCALARLEGRQEKADEYESAAKKLLNDGRMVDLVVYDLLLKAAGGDNVEGKQGNAETNRRGNQAGSAE